MSWRFRSRVRGSVPRVAASVQRPTGARPFATGIFGTVSLIGIVSQQLLSGARKHPPSDPHYACSGEARSTAKIARQQNASIAIIACSCKRRFLPRRQASPSSPSAYSKTTNHGTPARRQQTRRLAAPRFLNGPREHSAPELRTGASRV